MTTKAVKISEENYKWLCEVAGTLQAREGSRKTLDDALDNVRTLSKSSILDLAGSLDMTDKEAEDTKKGLKKAWRKWTMSA